MLLMFWSAFFNISLPFKVYFYFVIQTTVFATSLTTFYMLTWPDVCSLFFCLWFDKVTSSLSWWWRGYPPKWKRSRLYADNCAVCLFFFFLFVRNMLTISEQVSLNRLLGKKDSLKFRLVWVYKKYLATSRATYEKKNCVTFTTINIYYLS